MSKVRINQGRSVMFTIRFGGTILVFLMVAISFQYLPEVLAILTSIAISLLIPVLWSSFEILEIDLDRNRIAEYTLITGRRFSERNTPFEKIEKIFINQNQTSQTMTSMAGKVRNAKNIEYAAFLKLSNGKKFFMISDRREQHLLERLDPVAKKLNMEIVKNYE